MNFGASNDWADMEKFAHKALAIVAEHYSLAKSPEEIPVPTIMLQKFRVPSSSGAGTLTGGDLSTPPKDKPKTGKRWQFWK